MFKGMYSLSNSRYSKLKNKPPTMSERLVHPKRIQTSDLVFCSESKTGGDFFFLSYIELPFKSGTYLKFLKMCTGIPLQIHIYLCSAMLSDTSLNILNNILLCLLLAEVLHKVNKITTVFVHFQTETAIE